MSFLQWMFIGFLSFLCYVLADKISRKVIAYVKSVRANKRDSRNS